MATGRTKVPTRLGYLKLLCRIDRSFLVGLRRFGASSPLELAEAVPRSQALTVAGWPREQTVEDWLTLAQRRGLVELFVLDDPAAKPRWILTMEGRERARGWLRHLGPALRTVGAVIAGLTPLVIGGALFSHLGDVDWSTVLHSTVFEVIVVFLYMVFLVTYVIVASRSITIVPLGAIELTRSLDQLPALEMDTAGISES